MAKLILGVGTNSKGRHRANINGKSSVSYQAWFNMLQRAYCPKLQIKRPAYIGCSVDEIFHDYQDFAEWFENHKYSQHGYELDKDLLVPNNKVYAPDKVCFVPQQLNALLTDHAAARGQYPQGVSAHKGTGKLMARLSINGNRKYLGLFDTETEAYKAYKVAKEAYVKEKALEWQDRIADNVFEALMNWKLS